LCPDLGANANAHIDLDTDDVEATLLAYFNNGGALPNLRQTFEAEGAKTDPAYIGDARSVDVTGDRIPEILVWHARPLTLFGVIYQAKTVLPQPVQGGSIYVLACRDASIVTALNFEGYPHDMHEDAVAMPITIDLNANGVLDIVQPSYDFAGSGYGLTLEVVEWNGESFVDLITGRLAEDYLSAFASADLRESLVRVSYGSFELRDIDANGTTEVVIHSDFHRGQSCLLLYREARMVLMWNGYGYGGFYSRTPAAYRIQAVWDGDDQTAYGRLDDALASYQRAVSDDSLLSWSLGFKDESPLCPSPDSLTPIPTNTALDLGEWPRLAAYAMFRTALIHLLRDDLATARAQMDDLREGYGSDPASAIYVELAETFWDAYSDSRDIGQACREANSFALAHEESCDLTHNFATSGCISLPFELLFWRLRHRTCMPWGQ